MSDAGDESSVADGWRAGRIPWRRVFIEGLVIVVSILLAFAIDAWWEGWQERADVEDALRAVRAELVDNLAYFEDVARDHRRVAEGGFEMLGYTDPDPNPAHFERAKFLIGELWVRAGNDPPGSGAVSSLIASGSLGRVDSSELRRALAYWPNYIEQQQSMQRFVALGQNRFFERMILHVAQLDIDLVNGMNDFAEARGEFLERAPTESGFPSDYAGLLGEREFESAVTGRTTTALIAIELAGQATAYIEELITMIDAELGVGGPAP